PIRDVTHIQVAMPYAGSLSGVVLVRGKVDLKQFEADAQACVKADKGLKAVPVKNPPATLYERKLAENSLTDLVPLPHSIPAPLRKMALPNTLYFAALDEQTLMLSVGGKLQVVRALAARPVKTAPRISEDLRKVLEGQSLKEPICFVLMESCLHPTIAL